jgi:hypothetical protein
LAPKFFFCHVSIRVEAFLPLTDWWKNAFYHGGEPQAKDFCFVFVVAGESFCR